MASLSETAALALQNVVMTCHGNPEALGFHAFLWARVSFRYKIMRLDGAGQASWFQWFVLQRWLSKRAVFARSCRVIVETSESEELFRLSYVSTERDYASAEHNAELEVGRLLADKVLAGKILEVQWKHGRFVTAQTIRSESDSIRVILSHLRKDKYPVIINIEKIEGYSSRSLNGSGATSAPQLDKAS